MPNQGNQTSKPRRKSDALLKAAFEEHFVDFLRFLYFNADELFDFSREIVFMDKELHAIIPHRERVSDKRVADLLARVYLKDGSEKYILLNTEIEAGSHVDFAKRIYQYNYRIWDRYGISVATIAVFIGERNQRRPAEYWSQVLDTTISFRYRAYHIFDHKEAELLAMDNPFALVVLACQKALLEGKVPDEELGRDRLTIAKALLAHEYDRDRIISFLTFLKNFVYITNDEINRIFDLQIEELTGGNINMGIIETLKLLERQEAEAVGIEKGKQNVIENLIVKLGFSDEQAADVAEVSVDVVKQVRASLIKK